VRKLARDGIAPKRSITYAIHAYSAILNSSFYAYSVVVDSFVIACFYVEKHCIPQYYHWLKSCVCAYLSLCFGKVIAILGVIKSCTCS